MPATVEQLQAAHDEATAKLIEIAVGFCPQFDQGAQSHAVSTAQDAFAALRLRLEHLEHSVRRALEEGVE
jgi:hypothetical protein